MEGPVLSPWQLDNSPCGNDFRKPAHDRIQQFCRLERVFAASDKLQTPGRQRLATSGKRGAKTKIENPRAPDDF